MLIGDPLQCPRRGNPPWRVEARARDEGEVLAALREKGMFAVGQAYAVVPETSGTFSGSRNPVESEPTALADVEGIARKAH